MKGCFSEKLIVFNAQPSFLQEIGDRIVTWAEGAVEAVAAAAAVDTVETEGVMGATDQGETSTRTQGELFVNVMTMK